MFDFQRDTPPAEIHLIAAVEMSYRLMLDWGAKPRRQELSTYSTFTPDSATTFRVGVPA